MIFFLTSLCVLILLAITGPAICFLTTQPACSNDRIPIPMQGSTVYTDPHLQHRACAQCILVPVGYLRKLRLQQTEEFIASIINTD